jgi:hypothetical protein
MNEGAGIVLAPSVFPPKKVLFMDNLYRGMLKKKNKCGVFAL